MDLERSITLTAAPEDVFAVVDDLDDYPAWMPLVHRAVAASEANAWDVELRATVGPFARSKRLRMVRTACEPPHRVCFERAEVDGRHHAIWRLEAVVVARGSEVELVMRLHYGGRLWTGGLLERALEDQIVRGRAGLRRLLESSSPDASPTNTSPDVSPTDTSPDVSPTDTSPDVSPTDTSPDVSGPGSSTPP